MTYFQDRLGHMVILPNELSSKEKQFESLILDHKTSDHNSVTSFVLISIAVNIWLT